MVNPSATSVEDMDTSPVNVHRKEKEKAKEKDQRQNESQRGKERIKVRDLRTSYVGRAKRQGIDLSIAL